MECNLLGQTLCDLHQTPICANWAWGSFEIATACAQSSQRVAAKTGYTLVQSRINLPQ
jgi:hypothetical protein